jgi:energy-coupling factor transporter ATP-binding protein EcfA2
LVNGDTEAASPRRPVVGRGAELDIVVEHVCSNGQVLVTGEAGIGKSTLLDALVGRLRDDGFDVYRVAGTQALVAHPLAALGHLIGDPGDRSGPALASFAADRLKALARGSQAVIIADDAHAPIRGRCTSLARSAPTAGRGRCSRRGARQRWPTR